VELAAKLQLKPGQGVHAVRAPVSLTSVLESLPAGTESDAALLVFVVNREILERERRRIIEAVSNDVVTWVAYPKARQLGTDLNRDSLAALLSESAVQPVRQIAIDDTWSALRLRPGA
jgi:hypothetical protein